MRRIHPDLTPDQLQTLSLLVSELVANSVRHARTPWIEVRAEVSQTQVHVEVADDGDGFDPVPLPPDEGRRGGWGLYIVNELATRWGVIDGDGTRVWFELDR